MKKLESDKMETMVQLVQKHVGEFRSLAIEVCDVGFT
jgi:hypothetical protein